MTEQEQQWGHLAPELANFRTKEARTRAPRTARQSRVLVEQAIRQSSLEDVAQGIGVSTRVLKSALAAAAKELVV